MPLLDPATYQDFSRQGDPLADQVVIALRRDGERQRDMLTQVQEFARTRGGVYQAFMDQINTVPDWVDVSDVEQGQTLFLRRAPLSIASFVLGSLLLTYTPPGSARVLMHTGRLHKDVMRRLGVHVSERKAHAYQKLWRYANHLQGVDLRLQPDSIEAEEALLAHYQGNLRGPGLESALPHATCRTGGHRTPTAGPRLVRRTAHPSPTRVGRRAGCRRADAPAHRRALSHPGMAGHGGSGWGGATSAA